MMTYKIWGSNFCPSLLGWALDVSAVDVVDDVVRCTAIDCASNGLGGSQDLLHDARELLGLGAGPHGAGGVDDVVHRDVAVVLDVLHLLPVPGGLLQGLDDQGGGRGDDADLGLPVLDGQLDGDLQALPFGGGLGDVLANLLGGEAQGTDLGGQG